MNIPTLDARLDAVLNLIGSEVQVHADIGADHAHLPIQLIQTGRAGRCVVVEVNPGPLQHARQNVALAGLANQIEVRQGDGFAPIRPGEVDSASLCGMGALTMLGILSRAGESLPPALVLQPNDSPRPLRVWAQKNGFHLTAEYLASGFWIYAILRLERQIGPDLAYAGLPPGAALRYGPHLLRAGVVHQQILSDIKRLTPVAAPGRPAQAELAEALAALEFLEKKLEQ